MSARDPHWWHINGVQINLIKMQLMQTRWSFLFLARAFAPNLCDLIWSFSSWPLQVMSMTTRFSDIEDQTSGANLQIEGHMHMCHPKVKRALKRWEHWPIPPPTHHLGPQPGGHCPQPVLTLGTA